MMKKQIIEEIRDLLEKAYRERFYRIILYGSEARGEAKPDSDIDILVLLKGPIDYGADIMKNIDALYPLSCRLGRRISAKPVDKNDYETVVCPLYENAHNEGVIA